MAAATTLPLAVVAVVTLVVVVAGGAVGAVAAGAVACKTLVLLPRRSHLDCTCPNDARAAAERSGWRKMSIQCT